MYFSSIAKEVPQLITFDSTSKNQPVLSRDYTYLDKHLGTFHIGYQRHGIIHGHSARLVTLGDEGRCSLTAAA